MYCHLSLPKCICQQLLRIDRQIFIQHNIQCALCLQWNVYSFNTLTLHYMISRSKNHMILSLSDYTHTYTHKYTQHKYTHVCRHASTHASMHPQNMIIKHAHPRSEERRKQCLVERRSQLIVLVFIGHTSTSTDVYSGSHNMCSKSTNEIYNILNSHRKYRYKAIGVHWVIQ